ncbi:MAG TPA: hypothetical protein VJB34_05545 [Bdellovibrionota bacterium]|nr:hypothetical protein [Bdellovibrionota bacterium]
MKNLILYLLIAVFIVSCGVKKSPIPPKDDTNIESSSDDEEEEEE